MTKAKVWMSGICLVFLFSLTGCGKATLRLSEDVFYLCSYPSSFFFDNDVLLLDSSGSTVLELSRASVSACVLPDGTILDQTAGQIPKESYLIINRMDEGAMSGVWSLASQDWVLEPAEGLAVLNTDYGKLVSFRIGHQSYDSGFLPISSVSDECFTLADGTVLTNAKDNAGKYISTESGERYLDENTFYTVNEQTLSMPQTDLLIKGTMFPMPQSDLRIEGTIQQKYLLISGDFHDNSDGLYLCDQNGVILYGEWNYDRVSEISNPTGSADSVYLKFENEEGERHYLNLNTGKEFIPPEGWEVLNNRYNDLFLLQNADQYAIYNAASGLFGSVFSLDSGLLYMHILGMDSYAVKTQDSVHVVIGGEE